MSNTSIVLKSLHKKRETERCFKQMLFISQSCGCLITSVNTRTLSVAKTTTYLWLFNKSISSFLIQTSKSSFRLSLIFDSLTPSLYGAFTKTTGVVSILRAGVTRVTFHRFSWSIAVGDLLLALMHSLPCCSILMYTRKYSQGKQDFLSRFSFLFGFSQASLLLKLPDLPALWQ